MKSTLSVILFVFIAVSINAEEKYYLPTVTISSYVANQYLGFETGNPLSKDPVSQTELNALFPCGIFADFCLSRSLNGKWDDGSYGNEVDYTCGWKGSLATNLTLKVGMTYFDEPKAFTLGRGDIFNPWIYVTKSFKNFSVTAGYENFTPFPGSSFKGGNLFSIGPSVSRSFWNDRIDARASAQLVYDTGTIGSGKGFLWRGNIGLDAHVTKHVTWNILGMNWYVPMMHDKRSTDAMIWSGITLAFN